MSLPREPRQKMINMMYLVLTALLALNVSSEILNAFKTVNRSLENTNKTVGLSTQTIMKSLEEKKLDQTTKIKAENWYPKALQVTQLSKGVFDYIQGLKNTILEKAGGNPKDSTKRFKEDNLDIATRLMVDQGEGKKLYAALDKYKKDLMAIDPEIKDYVNRYVQIDLTTPPTQNKGNRSWEAAYFRMVPTVAAMTILSKFQNDIKTSENKVVAFCHEKVGQVVVRYDKFAAIIGQNSTYLMPGQKITINAGVGAYSKASAPIITIGSQNIPVNEDGVAITELDAGAIGDRSIPVKIVYKDQDGNEQTVTKNVEYTVGQANASIALDEMNVMYIGYDNKVSVAASGGGGDRVTAAISGGGGALIKTGPGKYVAKVNSVTDDCKITVMVDGKVAGVSQFRVRTIPAPVATIGGVMSNENMNAGTLRAQAGVGAFIKDFPLNLQYKVTGFTLVMDDPDTGDWIEAPCQGNLWSPKALGMIKSAKAGQTVSVDNIRAVGPDGRSQKLPGLTYYIK